MKDFVRTTGPVIEVKVISEPHSGNPESKWVEFETLPPDATHEQLLAAKSRALADPRFFGRCEKCGTLNPTGLMHDRILCQACVGISPAVLR